MIKADKIRIESLEKKTQKVFELAAKKTASIAGSFDVAKGAPVFTVKGVYTARGWTEWTQGFQFGAWLLIYDATGNKSFLEKGRSLILKHMCPHLTHFGVHDHGFNNVSTYGNLLRLIKEGKIDSNEWERALYETALKCSGAVQARRWTEIKDGGYIYSFNGPHSLFADTIRSLRPLAVAWSLGHKVLGENDREISLMKRLLTHAFTTAKHAVYYGKGRDFYDTIPGRVAHESIFNLNDGCYRCPNSQQGYSPFTTWTRGLAWIMCGFAEQLEFIDAHDSPDYAEFGGKEAVLSKMEETARAVCDFYIGQTPPDGVPYWDTGAPGLALMGDYMDRTSDPFNEFEPVDSSAAAIAAQGLLRLGRYLKSRGRAADGEKYWSAGLKVSDTIFGSPYISEDDSHQGLILHSVYHRPNGWDYIPPGSKIPRGESSMWGDYHAIELALYIHKIIKNEKYLTFQG